MADGERAVGCARLTGTHEGDLIGLSATGRQIDTYAIGPLRFRDAQLSERWAVTLGVVGNESARLIFDGAAVAARYPASNSLVFPTSFLVSSSWSAS